LDPDRTLLAAASVQGEIVLHDRDGADCTHLRVEAIFLAWLLHGRNDHNGLSSAT
jgi:hypothetical protein